MSFFEFLHAMDEEGLIQAVKKASPDAPLDDAFHNRLNNYLQTYMLIGGMPEAVLAYRETGQLRECQNVLSDLVVTFRDDFAKYRKRTPTARLEEAFESIPHQAGSKFIYSRINPATHSLALRCALDLLIKSGLAYRINHTDWRGLPLGAQVNPKRFKVGLVDIGLHQRLLGLDISAQLVAPPSELANRGAMAELFAAQELRCHSHWREPAELYYWHREARSSNAEVDLVAERKGQILPIEVKSGRRGGMQSLRLFMRERGLQTGIRTSMEPFGRVAEVLIVPLYAFGSFMSGQTPKPR
jgi:predicted AAA+ superfamily ATPase